jgi:hypothetical protein
MVWLLSGLVLAVGLVVLIVLAVMLLGHVRRNQSAVTALRISFQDGSSRMRAGQEIMRERRAARRDPGTSELSA